MAFKIDTNALVLAKKFEKELTTDKLANWAQAAIGNTYEGDDERQSLGFPVFVKYEYMQGQAMNESSYDGNHDSWLHYLKRGWHHNSRVRIHKVRRGAKRGKVEMTIGMYAPESMQISLNYLLKNLRKTGQQKFMQRAWTKYKGNARVKEQLAWMYEKALDKVFREENGAQ